MIHGSSLLASQARRVFALPPRVPFLVVRSVTRMLRCEVAPAASVHSRVVGRCRVAETRLCALRGWPGNLVSYARMTLQAGQARPRPPAESSSLRGATARGAELSGMGLPEAGSCAPHASRGLRRYRAPGVGPKVVRAWVMCRVLRHGPAFKSLHTVV